MNFLLDNVLVEGCFYDRKGQLKARIDKDKHIIRDAYNGQIIGYIRDTKVYDEYSNYMGYFKNNSLYAFGGRRVGSWREFSRNNIVNNNKASLTCMVIYRIFEILAFVFLILIIIETFF